MSKQDKIVLPGEALGVTEEFENLEGTYNDEGTIRASHAGKANYNMTDRTVAVRLQKKAAIPNVGDSIVGLVESAQPAAVNMKILAIGAKRNDANLNAMMLLRGDRRAGRARAPCSTGDIVIATVISTLNSIIHVSFQRAEDGVIHTRCPLCGGDVIRIQRYVKCVQCGNRMEKRLSSEFISRRESSDADSSA